jgi:prevent-host-death family protein
MNTKLIPSTEAQNNFGRILDDAVQNGTRYIVQRRSTAQVIILSLSDFENILAAGELERKKLEAVVRELSPVYSLGEPVAERE